MTLARSLIHCPTWKMLTVIEQNNFSCTQDSQSRKCYARRKNNGLNFPVVIQGLITWATLWWNRTNVNLVHGDPDSNTNFATESVMKDKVHQTTQASIFMSWKYELTMNWCTMSSVNAHCAALPSLSPATQKMRPLHSSWPDHPFPGLKAPAQLWNYTTGLVPPVYLIPLLLCRFTLNCYLVFCTSHPLPPGCKVMINSCPT